MFLRLTLLLLGLELLASLLYWEWWWGDFLICLCLVIIALVRELWIRRGKRACNRTGPFDPAHQIH